MHINPGYHVLPSIPTKPRKQRCFELQKSWWEFFGKKADCCYCRKLVQCLSTGMAGGWENPMLPNVPCRGQCNTISSGHTKPRHTSSTAMSVGCVLCMAPFSPSPASHHLPNLQKGLVLPADCKVNFLAIQFPRDLFLCTFTP